MAVEPNLLRHVLIGAAVGLPAGVAYFAALRRNVQLYVAGGFGYSALAFHLLRLAIVAVLFFFLAKLGVGALLSGLAAFLLARTLALHGPRRHA